MRPVFSLLLLFFVLSSAGQKIRIIQTPEWLVKPVFNAKDKTTPDAISNGYYFSHFEKQVNLINQTVFHHQTRRIVNETGVQNASEVSVTYAPQYESLNFHFIRLVRNGKIVREVNESEIRVVDAEDEADAFLYSGSKRAFVLMKGVEKNDEIDFSFSLKGFNPVYASHYGDKYYFASGIRIENNFSSIIAPLSRTLTFRVFNGAPLPEEIIDGDKKIYQWNNPPIKAWKWKSSVPEWFDDAPYLTVTTFNDWKEVITWGTDLFQNYNYPLPDELLKMMDSWRKRSEGDRDKFASIATQFVQDKIRYLGLEIGTHTHKPHDPAETFNNRFGDCKDKALLLALILRHENIQASVALVNTVAKQTLEQALPSATAFNHAIVAIPDDDQQGYRFIDPTISGQRGSFSSLFVPDYGYALVLNRNETALREVSGPDNNLIEISEVFRISNEAKSLLKVKTSYSGKAADRNRLDFEGVSNKTLGENYVGYYSKFYEGIELAKPVSVDDDSVANILTVDEEYNIPDAWEKDENDRKIFSFAAQQVYSKIPDPSGINEELPLAMEYPLKMVYALQLYMPEKWPVSFSPLHISNEAYQFDFTPRVDGNVIYLEYYLKTHKDHIPASMMAEYKKDYERIKKKMEYGLYSNETNDSVPGRSGDFSVQAFLVFLFAIAGMAFLVKYLNKQRTENEYNVSSAWPIGGWLVVLGLSLFGNILLNAYKLFSGGYFRESTWVALKNTGGTTLQAVGLIEFMVIISIVVYSVGILYWFLNRRDIFPKMFTAFVITLLATQLLMLGLYNISDNVEFNKTLSAEMGTGIVRILIYGAVWITYIQKSDRVKYTFLIPYNLSEPSPEILTAEMENRGDEEV